MEIAHFSIMDRHKTPEFTSDLRINPEATYDV